MTTSPRKFRECILVKLPVTECQTKYGINTKDIYHITLKISQVVEQCYQVQTCTSQGQELNLKVSPLAHFVIGKTSYSILTQTQMAQPVCTQTACHSILLPGYNLCNVLLHKTTGEKIRGDNAAKEQRKEEMQEAGDGVTGNTGFFNKYFINNTVYT